jgi:carboxypeptidase Taq
MEKKLKKFKAIVNEAADLYRASEILGWDQETNMPPGGAESRGNIRGTLEKLSHERYTSDELARLLEELESEADQFDPDSDDARLIRYIRRDTERKKKLPSEMVAEKAKLLPPANQAWRQAREESEWSIFEPHLEKLVDLTQRTAEYYKPYDHIYDSFLDEYEPGMKTREVQAIFNGIRPKQVELIEAISKQPQVDDSVLFKNYPKGEQIEMGVDIITKFGYDFNRGRIDEVHHPFASTMGYGDNRLTYRVDEKFLNTFVFAVMHESGHAMYEQGIAKELDHTPLYEGTSLGLHESQSRLWENLVGRSKAFWEWYYPKFQKRFPAQAGGVSLDDFYKAVNKVEPSLIRVEADEATYNLHIMLRLEIEIGLLEGEFKVKELPEVWNTRFKKYLGITPKNDAEGVLQDVHWSFGLFGYFSTYALGNLISLQIWEKVNSEIPNLEDQIRAGDFTALLSWLQDKVYRHGKKFEPQELVERVTGSKIDGGPYIKYLNKKFGEIYGL